MLVAVIVLAVVLAIVLVALVAVMLTRRRSAALHERFGPEYDRVVEKTGGRRAAEQELEHRTQRREQLNIRPLDAMQREAFAASWRNVQARFVDTPREAVADAEALVRDVMQQRGYPVGEFDQQEADLSVDHADVLNHYRAAHEVAVRDANSEATTEDLRAAMVHYRAMFDSLLKPEPSEASAGGRR